MSVLQRFLKKVKPEYTKEIDTSSKKTEASLLIVFFEIALFLAIYILIGVLFNKNDIFFLKSRISPVLLISLFLGLYYGAFAGITLIGFIFLLNLLLYKELDYKFLLWNTAIVLIANEFRYHWQKKINLAYIELYNTREYLERLRENFFLLNLSHKELENYYVRRSYSLRDMMSTIRQKAYETKDVSILFGFLLDILYNHFSLKEGCILKVDGNDVFTLASNTNCDNIEKDPLVQKAIEEKNSFYIPITRLSENINTEMLATVSYSSQSFLYLVCIKDMHFTYLQEEVMDYIRILLGYIVENAEFIETASQSNIKIICSIDFTKELFYSKRLYEDYNIESYIVVFGSSQDVSLEIQSKIRGSDVFCYEKKDGGYVFYVLLYFSIKTGVDKFLERLSPEKLKLEIKEIIPVYEYSKLCS